MSLVLRLCRGIDALVRAVSLLGFLLFPALILVCVFEVVARYVFNAPTIWAFDITFMLHGALFMLTGAYGQQKNVHVRIDVLSTRLPPKIQHAANLIALLFLFIPAIWLLGDAALRRAFSAYESGEVELASAWGPIVWPFFTALSIGLVALFLQSSAESIRHLVGIVTGRGMNLPDSDAD